MRSATSPYSKPLTDDARARYASHQLLKADHGTELVSVGLYVP